MNRCLAWLGVTVLVALLGSAAGQNRRKPPPVAPAVKVPEVDQNCMNCLCQASSDCDETLKCHNAGGSAYFCGPYVISWAYWHDGGRPGDKGRAHDFETCLNNKTCAEQAVRGYMRKYGQDCDGSGSIDCFDFARIHKLGYGACGGDAIYNTDYWEKFEVCALPDSYDTHRQDGYNPNRQDGYDYGGGGIDARNSHIGRN